MQAVYILLTIIGLIICFGGIYFRKPIATLAGFINGLFLGVVVLVIMTVTYNDVEYELAVVLIIALIVAVICFLFDRFFAALSAFISSLITLAIFVLLICSFDTIGIGLIVTMIVALGLAVLSYIYYKYSFAIVTAFTGGLAAAIGITSLITGNALEDYMSNVMWGDGLGMIIGITVILTLAGSSLQISGIHKQEELKRKIEAGENTQINQALVAGIAKMDFSKLITLLQRNWFAIVIPMLTVFIPVIFGGVSNIGAEHKTYGSFIAWTENITIAIMLGCMIYVVTKDRIKEGIIIAVMYNLLYILANYENYFASQYSWIIGATAFKGLITGAILIALHLIIKDKDIKLTMLPIIIYISFEYVMNWIESKSLFAITFDVNFIINVAIVYVTVLILYYHDEKVLIYTSKKNIISLIIVVIICGGIWGLQKWQTAQAEKEAKGGWQNYEEELEEYNQDDQWIVIENEEDYKNLIEGDINIEQLDCVFKYFPEGASTEDINSTFEENSYWMTFMICDSLEQQIDEESMYTIHKYELKKVNDTLKGFTSFQYKKNTQYSEEEYTDSKYLYLMIPATGWIDDMFIKNIRGRYNQEEMIIDYDWYEYYYEESDTEEIYLYSLSAVFNKNENGKFVLKEIQ